MTRWLHDMELMTIYFRADDVTACCAAVSYMVRNVNRDSDISSVAKAQMMCICI